MEELSNAGGSGNVILVIGDAQVGKRYLVQHLQGDKPATAPTTDTETKIETHALTLDTKYYSADLHIHLLPASTHAAFADSADAVLTPAARASFQSLDVQSVILIFHLSHPATFHSLVNAWQAFLADRRPEVVMMVGNAPSEPKSGSADATAQQELEQLAKDWALDHQVEYVRMPRGDKLRNSQTRLAAPSAAESSSSRPRSSSHSDDDLEAASEPIGLARIRESLECNAWPEMRMKDRKQMKYMQHAEKAHRDQEEAEEEEQEENDRREAAAFASMQNGRHEPEEMKEGDEKFDDFVSASSVASSTSNVSTAAPISSIPSTSASKPAAATSSSSASAFANAFASAIRTDDAPSTEKSPSAAPSDSAGSTGAPIDDPLSIEDVDRLAEHLSRISANGDSAPAPDAAVVPAGEHTDRDDRSDRDGATFDALFDKITTMKNQLNQPKADGSKLTDEERREKAEQNIRALLASMGMEDELDSETEE